MAGSSMTGKISPKTRESTAPVLGGLGCSSSKAGGPQTIPGTSTGRAPSSMLGPQCRLFPMPDIAGISFGAAQFHSVRTGRREAEVGSRKGRRGGANAGDDEIAGDGGLVPAGPVQTCLDRRRAKVRFGVARNQLRRSGWACKGPPSCSSGFNRSEAVQDQRPLLRRRGYSHVL